MTTYDPEDQAERRRVLQNDTRVRDQSRNGYTSFPKLRTAGARKPAAAHSEHGWLSSY
jgi:hypothetical protein